jgi:predicted amidohydrolase
MSRRIERIRNFWRGRVETHLCDRALLSAASWKTLFLKLVNDVALVRSEIGRAGDPPEDVGFDAREPLVWVWCVLETMPNSEQQHYQHLREHAADGSGIEDRADLLRQRGYAMAELKTAIAAQVPWLAALARALDDDLAALQYWPEDVTQWSPDDWRPPGYGCFVVPVRRDFRLGNGRPAQRRAFRNHAVIPDRIGSLAVSLYLHPDAALEDVDVDPTGWTFGSAIFPDLAVVPVALTGDTFRLVEARIAGDEQSIVHDQIAQAREAGCDVLVWPELTIPEERLVLLKKSLSEAPLLGHRIPLVVAGSWHVRAEGVSDVLERKPREDWKDEPGAAEALFVNRSEVLLGDGEALLSYDKRRRFPFGELDEGIETGAALPVIVMEDRLIGVAICRDNCDDNARETYRDLPLDLVLVPSMGAESTVEAHERHAKAQRSRQGTLTLVVQQNLAIEGQARPAGPPAFSFIRPQEVKLGDRPNPGQDEPFRTLG